MTRFVRVIDQYATYNVPTEEEYEDFQQRIGKQLDRLESRIATIEKMTPVEEESEVYKVSLFSIANGELELTGTEEQQRAFEISREQIDKSLFPRFLTMDKLVLLALDCGLSVKKIKYK